MWGRWQKRLLHQPITLKDSALLLLIGANHQTTPLELREKLFLNADQQRLLLAYLKSNTASLEEVVVLSTCNRLEVYSYGDVDDDSQNGIVMALADFYQIDSALLFQHLYIKTDREVVVHLMGVASGLDSLVLGEPQVLGQVATALEIAQSINANGAIFNRLFTDAIHAGKRARSETDISRHSTSISHIAAFKIKVGMPADSCRVLVIGAGQMAASAARAMAQHHIMDVRIVNRTDQRAIDVANQVGAIASLWEQRWTQLAEVDAVIIATSAAEPILKLCDLQFLLEIRKGQRLTIIDISVPRAVEVGRCELPTLTYIDIDNLRDVVDEHLAQRQACIPQVQTIIAQESETFMAWLASRQIVSIIKGLRQKVRHVVQDELDDVLTRLSHLDDQDKAALQRFAHRVINKVLHDPTTNLRLNASKSTVIDYTQVVSDLFALKVVD